MTGPSTPGTPDLAALSEAATPGPWEAYQPSEAETYVYAHPGPQRVSKVMWIPWTPGDPGGDYADAAFIVALVNAWREGRLVEREHLAWLCAKCGHGSVEHGMKGHPAYDCVAEMRLGSPL